MMKNIKERKKFMLVFFVILASVMMGITDVDRRDQAVAVPEASMTDASSENTSPKAVSEVSHDEIKRAVHLSAGYLLRACDDKGKFAYSINLDPDVKPGAKYNILRHAGTIYALAMYEEMFPSHKTREILNRAAGFLIKEGIAPLGEGMDMLAVWSYPELSRDNSPVQAKLGGTGLGLVALLSVDRIMPGTVSMDLVREMGNFVLFMQKGDGSFYAKYIPSAGGRNDEWTSLYYPGEAALGLMMLYEKEYSVKWLNAAVKAISYLSTLRAGRTSVEPDHWALLATARLLPHYDLSCRPVSRTDIIRHALQVAGSMYAGTADLPADSPAYGCLTGDGRTTPTSTRLEGLQAALTFLEHERSVSSDAMKERIAKGIRFLVNSQVKSGRNAGAIPRNVRLLPQDQGRREPVGRRTTEVRIDYVQHALSAMIQYMR
jgi:hypothetical protein